MADDDSSSTMSYQSSADMSSDVSSMTSSSYVDPLDVENYHEDSNLDDPTDIIADQMKKSRSALYEISVDIKINLPRDETFNKPDILRATIYTICGDIFFKYPEWKSVASEIVFQLGRALCPTSSIWIPLPFQQFGYYGKKKVAGHSVCVDQDPNLPIVSDVFMFSNFICASYVHVEYSVEIFLSPGLAGVREFYDRHGFKMATERCGIKAKYMDDVFQSQQDRKGLGYNHHLAWAAVYNVLDDYRQNIAKQNQFFDHYGFPF